MPAKRNIMPEEVRNAKLLLSKGLSDAEVASIIGRSVSAVVNIRNGAYDFILEDVPNDTPDDSRVYILLKSIDSRLYRQNDDMKAVIDRLTGLNAAIVELKNEINVCSSCMTAMLDALNELKSKTASRLNRNPLLRSIRARILRTGERLFAVLRSTVTSSLRTTCAEPRPVWTALRCIWPAPPARRSSSKAALLQSPASNSSAGTFSATA